MLTVFWVASALAVGWPPAVVRAQMPVERAWTILEQNAVSTKDEIRIAAVGALGLVVKDARRLAESKLTDANADIRAGAIAALGQIGLPASVPATLRAFCDDAPRHRVLSEFWT